MPASGPTSIETETPRRIVRVDRALLPAAAERLVQAASSGGSEAVGQFLMAARAHDIDLRRMWASVEGDPARAREVCLVVPGAGRTAMFFTSRPEGGAGLRELGAVIGHACDRCGDVARVGQALLERKDEPLAAAYEAGGFGRIARLWYLTRPAPRAQEFPEAEPTWPEGVTVRGWSQGDDPALASALERSYERTLDCPELSRMRRPEDVLESHRAAGQWDPGLWWLIRLHGRPAGAMLLNPSPPSGSVELVYLGLGPELRGRGLGSSLLRYGLSRLADRGAGSVTCAVDQRNRPACRLYERFGFVRFDERLALVRVLGAGRG